MLLQQHILLKVQHKPKDRTISALISVEFGIVAVEVLLIHSFPCAGKGFTETLEVGEFSLAEESYDVANLRVIGKP